MASEMQDFVQSRGEGKTQLVSYWGVAGRGNASALSPSSLSDFPQFSLGYGNGLRIMAA